MTKRNIIILIFCFGVFNSVKTRCQNVVSDSSERIALMAIYNNTDGAHWNLNQRWSIGKINSFPDSALFGVTITHGDVTQILIASNNLEGTIPPEINNLAQLQYLNLQGNTLLSDTLPDMSGLQGLKDLYLSNTGFTGLFPSWLCSMPNLEVLDLSGVLLTGPLPSCISSMTGLKNLFLRGMDLSMTNAIPSTFQDLDALNVLAIQQCQLVPGSFAAGLSGLDGLTYLDLTGNSDLIETGGTFPNILDDLPNLSSLNLSNINFQLLPADFNELTSLQSFFIENTDFSDTSRLANIVDTLRTVSSLKTLSLALDEIQSLPPNFYHVANLTTLYLSNNSIIPANCQQLGLLSNLQVLHLNGDHLTSIPSSLSNLTSLRTLDLNQNQLNPLPTTLDSIAGLENLDISSNGITSLPTWFGTGALVSLTTLTAKNNQLTLPLASSFANLTNLQNLDLSSNQLGGLLPSYLGDFTELTTLNLSNNEISSPLPDISTLTDLHDIRLAHNNLSGKVPATLTNNPVSKTYVDISFNHFDTLSTFHSDGNMTVIINNNRLDFANILKVAKPLKLYVYIPQDTLTSLPDSLQIVNGYVGDTLTLEVPYDSITHGATVYQWWHFVGGHAVAVGPPSTSGIYTDPNFNPSDTAGHYYYTSTNPSVPGLTLTSSKYKVKLAPCRSDASGSFRYSRYICAYTFVPPVDTRNCKAVTYQWNFDDGKTSADKTPFHSFTSAGTYDVSLTIHYKCGTLCAPDTTIHRTIVFDPDAPFVPYEDSALAVTTRSISNVISHTTTTFSDAWQLQDADQAPSDANGYLIGESGVWRNDGSYVFKEPRKQSSLVDLAHDGTFTLKDFNWDDPESNDARWIKSNTVTQYSSSSYELENQDVLGIYSSALYDYGGQLQTANGVNMRNDEMAFTSFESIDGKVTGNFVVGTSAVNTAHYFRAKSALGNMVILPVSINEFGNPAFVSVTARGGLSFTILSKDSVVCVTPYAAHPEWTTVILKTAPFVGLWTGDMAWYSQYVPSTSPTIDHSFAHSGFSSLSITTSKTFSQPMLHLDSAKQYLLNCWVSVKNASLLNPHLADDLGIDVVFKTKAGSTHSTISLTPMGTIIEGWQQVKGTFTCPVNDALIELTFKPGSTGHAWYDDLRFHPDSGNMKSYVYDVNDYRLISALDEENFGSFYFYDREGNLFLTKKETERGVKTISENVDYVVEQQ